MFGMKVRPLKGGYLDVPGIRRATAKAAERVLKRSGAFVMTSARQSIRKRKKPAPAGSPPSSHTGALKRFIRFAFEPGPPPRVLIGPERLQKPGFAPPALEAGGRETLKRRGKSRTLDVRPHPFMVPALRKEAPKLANLWRDAVK